MTCGYWINPSRTRWYSSNGPAARLLRWTVFVLCLVMYGHVHCGHTCPKCYMYSCPNICILPYLPLFSEINFVWKATFAKKILFPGSIISQEVSYSRRLHFPGRQIFQKLSFTMKSHFPGINTFPRFIGKPHFPKSHISLEVTFHRKTQFPESHISREVQFLRKSLFREFTHFREVTFPGTS